MKISICSLISKIEVKLQKIYIDKLTYCATSNRLCENL